MKKLFIVMMALLFAGAAFGAGTVTQEEDRVNTGTRTITFTCIGDSSNGSIPDTDVSDPAFIKGWRLYDVEVNPGTPAPDAADVLI